MASHENYNPPGPPIAHPPAIYGNNVHANAAANLNTSAAGAVAGGTGLAATNGRHPGRGRLASSCTRTYLVRMLYAPMVVTALGQLVLGTLKESMALKHLDLEPIMLGMRLGFYVLTVLLGIMSLLKGPSHWFPYVLGTMITHPIANPAFGDFSITIVLGIAITYGFKHNATVRNALDRLATRVTGNAPFADSYNRYYHNGVYDEENGTEFTDLPPRRNAYYDARPAIDNHPQQTVPAGAPTGAVRT